MRSYSFSNMDRCRDIECIGPLKLYILAFLVSVLAALIPSPSLAETVTKKEGSALDVRPDANWYLVESMMQLDPSNRFLGSINAVNQGSVAVYLRVSVSQLDLVNNVRTPVPGDEDGALKAFPEEFILRPGETFPIRLLADLAQQAATSQSYYVKVEDVSHLQPGELNSKQGGAANGFVLAYQVIVSVNKDPINTLKAEHFSLSQQADGKWTLQNLSGQHIYLNRAGACPDTSTLLVDCPSIKDFPRQSLLPNEILTIPEFNGAVLGILVYPKINMRTRPDVLYLTKAGVR